MRSYEEMADNILRKYDSYLEKKHRKTVIIKRAAALTLGTAAILGIGIFANALKPPQKPNPEQSGIVVETETTSAKTAYDLIAAGTTATRTTVTKQLETTAVSSVTTTSSESNTRGRKQTTEKAKATTVKTSSATTSLQTMSTVVSETTTMPVNTTTNAGAAVTTTSFPDYEGMVVQNFKKLQPFENSSEYFMINNGIESSKIGEKITETTLAPALFTEYLPDSVRTEIYEVTAIDSSYMIGARFENSEKTYGFINIFYEPQKLGDLIDDLNMNEEAVFNGAYIDTYDHSHNTIEYNVNHEEIMNILEENRNSINVPEYSPQGKILANISVSLPIAGIKNVSIRIMDDGFITTNLTAYGASFYLGESNTERLLGCLIEK